MHQIAGCCTNCDKEIYEIIARYSNDHPLAKEPLKIGKSLDSAVKHVFLLTDGSTMDVTFCDECQPDDLPKIWRTVLASWAREMDDTHRNRIGLAVIKDKTPYQNWFFRILNELPLAVIASQKINDGRIIRDSERA